MRQLFFNILKIKTFKRFFQHHGHTKKGNLIFIRKMEKLFKNNLRNSAFSPVANTTPFQFIVVLPQNLQTEATKNLIKEDILRKLKLLYIFT